MKQLDILIPFALPPAEMARDLLRQAHAPALAMLLGRGKAAAPAQTHDPFARALPHEHWLTRRFGLPATAVDNSPAAAAALLRSFGHDPDGGHWFVLHPAHIHVARDHLVLTDIAQLDLDEAQSRALFASAEPLVTELGHGFLYGDARTWFLRADAWAGLRTSTPTAASGRNIDIWMPEGPGELPWRKLQNEVQMQWFSDALNEDREMRGLKAVNSIWLWGGADHAIGHASGTSDNAWARTLTPAPDGTAEQPIEAAGLAPLLVANGLTEAALAEEWGIWLDRLATLDGALLAPRLQSLRDGEIDQIRLILTGADRLREYGATRGALRRFWAQPSLSGLKP